MDGWMEIFIYPRLYLSNQNKYNSSIYSYYLKAVLQINLSPAQKLIHMNVQG